MRTATAALQLTRPLNVAIAMLSVLIAVLITRVEFHWLPVVLACLSAGLIMAGGNTINDYFDIDIDRINKPQRPLPSGSIPPNAARLLAYLEFITGNFLAVFISDAAFLMALFFTALIYWYSARLKRIALWGNLAVSLSTAAAFVYGALAVGNPAAGIFPAILAFLFHFAREIIKDMEDVAGDQKNGADTLPIRYGMRPAIRLAWAIFAALLIATVIPFSLGDYGRIYLSIVVIGVWPVIVFVSIRIFQTSQPDVLNKLSNLLKLDMLIGLIALFFR